MTDHENRTFQDKFMLRLPDGMRERIRTAAEQNNRSMNAEIVALLGERFPPPADPPMVVMAKRLAADMGLDIYRLSKSDLMRLEAAIREEIARTDVNKAVMQAAGIENQEEPEPFTEYG